MAKREYEVIVKGMTVYGKSYGELVELDESDAKRFLAGGYVAYKTKADEVKKAEEKAGDKPADKPKKPAKPKADKNKK